MTTPPWRLGGRGRRRGQSWSFMRGLVRPAEPVGRAERRSSRTVLALRSRAFRRDDGRPSACSRPCLGLPEIDASSAAYAGAGPRRRGARGRDRGSRHDAELAVIRMGRGPRIGGGSNAS